MNYQELIDLIRADINTKLERGRKLEPGETNNLSSDLIAHVLLLSIYDRLGAIQGELEQNLSSIYSAVDEIRDRPQR